MNRRLLWRKAWREIEQYASGGPLTVGVGRPCALALAALSELRPTASFFDAMDNFPEFHRGLSRRAMRLHEDAIAARVDLVVASSTFLAEKFARRGLRVERILNACDRRRREGDKETRRRRDKETRRQRDKETRRQGDKETRRGGDAACLLVSCLPVSPSPLLRSRLPSPVLGYLGCIGHWFDWPLVVRLAEALPQARVELVGPCAVGPPERLPANVRLLPGCRQSQAADHLARFSAGLIPLRPVP